MASTYRQWALLLHPDKCKLAGALEAFKKLAGARDAILSGEATAPATAAATAAPSAPTTPAPTRAPPPPTPPPTRPPPFWRRRAAGGSRTTEPRQRSLRKVGLIADAVWAELADQQKGRPLSKATSTLAREAALKKRTVWARSFRDSVWENHSTSTAERAAAAAVVEVASDFTRRLGLHFTAGDTLLPGRQQRRRSKLGVELGPAGSSSFRGSSDGAGFFELPPGHPLRVNTGQARPRFRFQLKCTSLPFKRFVDFADTQLLPAEAVFRRELHLPDATFYSAATREALRGSDYLVLLVVALPGFGRGVVGSHSHPDDLWKKLASTAVAHWAVLADGERDRPLYDHTGVFSAVARRRIGLDTAAEGTRGGGLQDPLLSLCRAWELEERLATDEWELEEDAALSPGARRLRYARYVLARTRPLQHASETGDLRAPEASKARISQLLGKKRGRNGSLSHHRGALLTRTARAGGDKGGRSREFLVKRARLAELHYADTPSAPH